MILYSKEREMIKYMETLKNKNLIIVNGKAGSGKSAFLVDISNSIKDNKVCFVDLEGATISRLKLNNNVDVYTKPINDFSIIDKLVNDYDIIIIDYLQLLSRSLNKESTTLLSRLKELAVNLNKTIIISSCESSHSINSNDIFKEYADLIITMEKPLLH